MTPRIEYRIISSYEPDELARRVTVALNDNWALAGNLCACTDSYGVVYLYQALVRTA